MMIGSIPAESRVKCIALVAHESRVISRLYHVLSYPILHNVQIWVVVGFSGSCQSPSQELI